VLNSHAQVQTEEGMEQKEEVYANVISENLTLSGDLVVEGNLLIRGGNVNLNGHNLIVEGTLRHVNGRIRVNGGALEVKGNYYIETIEGGTSDGALVMSETFDTVKVLGDFVMNSSRGSGYNVFSAGVMEVKGDFIQKGIRANGSSENFVGKSEHKVVLNGDSKQTVRFRSFNSKINILEIENTSEEGIEFVGVFPIDKLRNDIVVKGNTVLDRNLDLNGYKLVVEGDLRHVNGSLKINEGTLEVKGNYYIETIEGGASDGALVMSKDSDTVKVFGDFVMNSARGSSYNVFSAGVMEVKGDFTQKGSGSSENFVAKSNHKLKLNGDEVQKIIFESLRFKINILEITKPLDTGYLIEPNKVVWEEVLLVEKGSEEPVEIKSFPEDIIYEDYTLDENLEFEGDLIITANIDLNGHTLVVKGDLWHLGGRISVNNGNLIVYGSYYIESFAGGQVDAKLAMINEEDYVQVFGDFVMHSISDNGSVLRAGTLEVKGDFYQRNELNNSNAVRNFEANGTHRVRLSGDKVQTVVFIDYPNSMFNILEITKPLETGYLFRNEGEVWKVLETNETSILYGDLNNDGVINSIDSSLMTRYILGVIDKFPYEDGLTAADLNGDKVINSIDSSLMTRYILGIIDKFPVE
jgi:cytoskeletal protein CcmA (bactofilin family)